MEKTVKAMHITQQKYFAKISRLVTFWSSKTIRFCLLIALWLKLLQAQANVKYLQVSSTVSVPLNLSMLSPTCKVQSIRFWLHLTQQVASLSSVLLLIKAFFILMVWFNYPKVIEWISQLTTFCQEVPHCKVVDWKVEFWLLSSTPEKTRSLCWIKANISTKLRTQKSILT